MLASPALAVPTSANAVAFGADLGARTPTSDTSCGYPPHYPGYFPLSDSCTFFSTATPTGNAAETLVVPLPDPAIHGNQSGTITQVRIKTGSGGPGPAKLTVLRANRAFNGGEAACCIGQAESAQFTLTPNSIVHLNADLPVASTYDVGTHIYSYDTLALTVLDGTTPIPAELSGDINGYCSTGYFPYVQTGQERFSGDYGVCGYIVLMRADMTIASKRADGGGGGGGGADGTFRLLGKPRTLANGNVALSFDLPGPGKLLGTAVGEVPAGLLAAASKAGQGGGCQEEAEPHSRRAREARPEAESDRSKGDRSAGKAESQGDGQLHPVGRRAKLGQPLDRLQVGLPPTAITTGLAASRRSCAPPR